MEAEAVTQQLANERAVSLRFILRAYDKALKVEAISEQSSTADWAKRFIIPCTWRTHLSWSEHVSRYSGMPVSRAIYHIVHSWRGEARALVIGAAEAANLNGPEPERLSDLLNEQWHEQHRRANLDVHFFICPFSVNQHRVQQHIESGPAPYAVGHPLCEIDKFAAVGEEICRTGGAMILILDNQRTALKRTCCLEELHAAITHRNPFELHMCGTGGFEHVTIDVQSAQAHDPHMKAAIDERIRTNPGFTEFNEMIRRQYVQNVEARSIRIDQMMATGGNERGRTVAISDSKMAISAGLLGANLFSFLSVNLAYKVLHSNPQLGAGICRAVRSVFVGLLPSGLSSLRILLGPGSTKILVHMEFQSKALLGAAWLLLDVAKFTDHLQREVKSGIQMTLDGSSIIGIVEPGDPKNLDLQDCNFDYRMDPRWECCEWEPLELVSEAQADQSSLVDRPSKENIARSSGSEIGREAVQMEEEALAFRRRVLPQDHPDIAESMNNLAFFYSKLGRHEEAVQMMEEVLAFRRRVLPQDHPDIALSMNNLAVSYSDLGRHEEAVQMEEEVLAFMVMLMGRHEEAMQMKEEISDILDKPPLRNDSVNLKESTLDDYDLLGELGRGGFGCVYQVRHKESGKHFALKQIDSRVAAESKPRGVAHEIAMQRTAGTTCKNIVRIYHLVDPENPVFSIIVDLFKGGDLVDGVNSLCRKGIDLKDAQAAFLTEQMMKAVQHIHRLNIVHRDVKIENFVSDRSNITDPNVLIALTDFGFAMRLPPGLTTSDTAGTVPYFAPEVFERRTGQKVDVWAIGCTAYVLLTMRCPFPADQRKARDKICHPAGPQVEMDKEKMSPEAISFIEKCLEPDPGKRFDAKTALKHVWLSDTPKRRRDEEKQTAWIAFTKTVGDICCCVPFGGNRFGATSGRNM